MRSTRTALLAAGSILLLVLAACGNGDDAAGGDEAAAGGGATISVEASELGEIVVDAEGRTLYAFLPDDQGASTCYDDCATTWPAVTVEGDPTGGDGVDAGLLGTTEREDGTLQVTYGGWPLYHFANDQTADDVNGQGVGDVWYVVSPEGSPVQDAGTAAGGGDDGDYGYGMG
jgi:predicted lipoprotein with Yx(FWY)xxD motif